MLDGEVLCEIPVRNVEVLFRSFRSADFPKQLISSYAGRGLQPRP
jgi:hypothetical protein